MRVRPARIEEVEVVVGYSTYRVLARVTAPKSAPHVGADSPRFMEPGTRGSARIFMVVRGGQDVTNRLDADVKQAITEAVEVKVGIRRPATVAARDTQRALFEEDRA